MTNIERLKMEIKGISLDPVEAEVYLSEEGLNATDTYDTRSNANKRQVYCAALAILNSIANQPTLMKNYKEDDITVSDFADSLQNRIDQLERKIRMMSALDNETVSSVFMLFG